MLRIKNEEMNIRTVLSSIKFLFEEIVIVDNGSTDHTMKVIEEFVKEEDLSDKVRIFSYPFEVAKCGDQNFETNEFSVHSLAYYYNWTLSKCTCKYIWKWDGDMVVDRSMVPDFIKFKNQVLENPGLVGVPVGITYYKVGLGIGFVKNDYYEMEPRLFPNSFLVCFKKDILWERLAFDYDFSMIKSEIPIYIELKDVTANEFGHWSNSSLAWGVRKVQEYKYFKEMQELVHSRKIAKNLSIPGYTRFDIKI
jgi:glycosyltransferase involved in cell wall biosynthesis